MQLVKSDDNRLFSVENSTGILYYDNYIIYQIPHYYTLSKVTWDTSGNVASEHELKNEIKFQYLICKDQDTYGYRFDSLSAKKPHVVSVDSFQKQNLFKGFPFFKNQEDTLLYEKNNSHDNTLTKTYKPKRRIDDSYPDTMKYSFTHELNGIDFSFSKELDSMMKMKLFKVEFITNPIVMNQKTVPRRVFLFEMKKNPVDTAAIIQFVKDFKKHESTFPRKKS